MSWLGSVLSAVTVDRVQLDSSHHSQPPVYDSLWKGLSRDESRELYAVTVRNGLPCGKALQANFAYWMPAAQRSKRVAHLSQ